MKLPHFTLTKCGITIKINKNFMNFLLKNNVNFGTLVVFNVRLCITETSHFYK
jgi:hypothetical protein